MGNPISQSFTIIPSLNGRFYSAYPNGNFPVGDGGIFFSSLTSACPGAYVTIYGFSLPNPATVRVNGKVQTVLNEAYDYDHLPLHPAMIKLGKDTGAYNIPLTVDGNFEPTNTQRYQKIDVILDNVIAGDTGLTVEGVGFVTTEQGLVVLTDTITEFSVHTGTPRFVAQTGSNANPGTEAQPWRTLEFARDNMANGDVMYVREGASDWTDTMSGTFGGNIGLYLDFSASGTQALPKAYSSYPGETVTFDASASGSFLEFPGSGGVVGDLTVHGFEYVFDGSGAKSICSWRPPSTKRRIRLVGMYGFGLYAGASGCFTEISGAGSSYFNDGGNGAADIRIIGNYCDLTSQPNLTNSNAHVYYYGGRSYAEDLYFLHNRNTRHGFGRVGQMYGHQGGRPSESGRNIHWSFNNLEGAKQVGQQPSVLRFAGYDPPPGAAGWYDDCYVRYNAFSGGSQGLHILGGPTETQQSATMILTIHDNVGYNNDTDIALSVYSSANIQDNITQDAISDGPGEATLANNSTDFTYLTAA